MFSLAQEHRQLDFGLLVGLPRVLVEVADSHFAAVVVLLATSVVLVFVATVKYQAVFVFKHLVDEVVGEWHWTSR